MKLRANQSQAKNLPKLPAGIFFVALAVSVIGASLAGRLHARTWRVPAEVPTIKEAVEDSASYGDTVLVAPGVYNTNSGEVFPLNMKSGVVLISQSGASETVIDANATERVINCEALDSSTVVGGFTVTGGSAFHGGGVYCVDSFLEIRGNLIRGNTATGNYGCGGGIYCQGGAPRIISNHISANIAPNYCGGGIYCYVCSGVIEANTVAQNTAMWGGGVFNHSSSSLITRNIVDRNHALSTGGGLDCYIGATPIITANVIRRNTSASHGAGIACCYTSSPLITYNTIASNVGSYGGGIRSLGGSFPSVRANIIVDNVDGIYLTPDSYGFAATDNNLYCNTYQRGNYEVINNTSFRLDLTDNFWVAADSASIDSLVFGPGGFIPFRTSPNQEAPGEPSAVSAVTLMADSTYSSPAPYYLNLGDTLYVQLQGNDWNGSYIDPALVIITSSKDPYGIAVALIETEVSTGIYRGTAYLDTSSSDLHDRVGANLGDTIIVRANVDPAKSDTVVIGTTGIEAENGGQGTLLAESCYLFQNYPNPFNRATEIRYRVSSSAPVSLEICNLRGQLVRTLAEGVKGAGVHAVCWDGRDVEGQEVTSGIYLCRLRAGDLVDVKKITLLR